MEELKVLKEMLTSTVIGQMSHLESVNTKELGEAIDMIKDLAEAMYYCTVTEAMEGTSYHSYPKHSIEGKKMHVEGEHLEKEMMHNPHEGRSPLSRKSYLESKQTHKDKSVWLQELEKYAQELTADLIEMVEGASPEEKQFLSNKIATLATKIK